MPVKRLYEGHYRALEKSFMELAAGLHKGGDTIRVSAAGKNQVERLRLLLAREYGGKPMARVEFFPGIRHLAQKLSSVPRPLETVSHGDRTLFALEALAILRPGEPMYAFQDNTETAHSLGCFFEKLYRHGITPGIYEAASLSLSREPSTTEKAVGGMLKAYDVLRRQFYSSTADMIMEDFVSREVEGPLIFYGFYDLSPLQRRFLRVLVRQRCEVYWFSPVSMNSQWKNAYFRTWKLLEELGAGEAERCGGRIAMNGFANFFEALPIQDDPAVPSRGFGITAVSGETGACRSVLKGVEELANSGVPLNEIAVVRRKERGGCLARFAHHEGVPVDFPLEASLIDMPHARLVLDLLDLIGGDFYCYDLQSVLASGLLLPPYSASPSDVTDAVNESGVRMGRERWRDWYSGVEDPGRLGVLLRKLDSFAGELPDTASSSGYLQAVERLFFDLTGTERRAPLLQAIFDEGPFRQDETITFQRFMQILQIRFQEKTIILRKADGKGFGILTPEQARGSLYRCLFLMDMEEGVFPRSQQEDPRLGEELRKTLQMSLKAQMEIEDGFLLRQAGESAEETLQMIYREQDSEGGEIMPSPFIADVLHRRETSGFSEPWFFRASSSPEEQLLAGGRPGQKRGMNALQGRFPEDGFFQSALKAEMSRLDFGSFDSYDGVLEGSPFSTGRVSPTMLENYVSCPFRFLVQNRRGWNVERETIKDVSSSPDPRKRGNVVHRAVEKLIRNHGFYPSTQDILQELDSASKEIGLSRTFQAEYLYRIFLESYSEGIRNALEATGALDLSFLFCEKYLRGTLGEQEIEGVVDLVLEDGDSNLVLVDIKTGNFPPWSHIDRGMSYQLPFYYQLALQNYPDRTVGFAAYMSVSSRRKKVLTQISGEAMAGKMEKVRNNLQKVVPLIRQGFFPPVPTSGNCSYCSLSGLCRRTPYRRIRNKVANDERASFFRGIVNRS
ncbi:MAG: hypothetical protein GF388_06535 [Candidatus Aegiribacteria sp.]|nr:hypothetical protein [Candidatus Aegiribacteria sp.]MBD3294808.1 hypothetical protein [Candidatus Fermentibacteria bacterium]